MKENEYCSRKSTPTQQFREECLADRGFRFVRWEGDDTVWVSRGINGMTPRYCKVSPAGDVTEIEGP